MITSNAIHKGRGSWSRRGALLLTLAAGFGLLSLGSRPVSGQAGPSMEVVQWQQLMWELRSLRIEMIQERIERANGRVVELQDQLRTAEAERAEASRLERAQTAELAELQDQLFQPGLTPEQRAEMSQLHTQMASAGAAHIAERTASASQREFDLRNQVGAQQQLVQRLNEALRVLAAATSANP